MKAKGFLLAALAAALYGTNPAFAVPLYGSGMNPASVLLFRYVLGIPLLAGILLYRTDGLLLQRKEMLLTAVLGMMVGISSLALYESYTYMNPGLASTLLFMYPVLTSLLMTAFFHETFRLIIAICLLIMGAGLYLLMRSPEGEMLNMKGLVLIFISSLTYAIYLVMIKVSKTIQCIPVLKSLMYQLLFGGVVFIGMLVLGDAFIIPHTLMQWSNLAGLAMFSTVISFLCTIEAIRYIGPTPTAIFGALEPITAVILSILILGETITVREVIGGFLILFATMLVVVADQAEQGLRRVACLMRVRKG